jgi:glutathione synthase
MKIGFLVNGIDTEKVGFTTVRLAFEAVNQGHDVYYFGVGDLAYDTDEYVRARSRTFPKKSYSSHTTFFKDLQGGRGLNERITVDDLDVLMLRNVPSDDFLKRPWATTVAFPRRGQTTHVDHSQQ